MRKVILTGIVIAFAVAMIVGCGGRSDYGLPDDPIEFNTSTLGDPSSDSEEYTAIEYDDRTYIPFGTLKGTIDNDDVGKCLGYLVQDGQKLEGVRLYTLTVDPDVNYLMEMDTDGEMSQATFYRAVDTSGEDIETPSFVESLNYEYWK